jgi:hypothetical protein
MKTSTFLLDAAIAAFTFASDAAEPLLSPRAAGNQIKVVKGSVTNASPALACLKMMKGTPKAVAECSSHANMPGCVAAMP